MSLKVLLTEAVQEHLERDTLAVPAAPPAWMSAFGGLRRLHKETKRIDRVLEQEFERIEEDKWR